MAAKKKKDKEQKDKEQKIKDDEGLDNKFEFPKRPKRMELSREEILRRMESFPKELRRSLRLSRGQRSRGILNRIVFTCCSWIFH